MADSKRKHPNKPEPKQGHPAELPRSDSELARYAEALLERFPTTPPPPRGQE